MGAGKTHEAIETVASVTIASVQYQPTDRPIEDRFSITVSPDGSRLILGVYDGHGGSDTAEHISNILPPALLTCPPEEHIRIFEATDKALLDAFQNDHAPFRSRSKEWLHNAKIFRSGCTALVLDIDVPGMVAHYANAGDCRALVCEAQVSEDPGLIRIQQTVDLNAKSQLEQQRLKREHPNEDELVVSGRLFGKLMSTRGFGDGYYKLPRGINGWKHKKYVDILSSLDKEQGKVPLNAQYNSYFYGYHTPPYLVATPDTGVMNLNRDSFIVCGSDGLYDLVTSEDVAQTVRQGICDKVGNLAVHLLGIGFVLRDGNRNSFLTITSGQHRSRSNSAMEAVTASRKPSKGAVVFDLMGTCTDWKSSIVASLERQPRTNVDLPSLAAAWRSGFFNEIHRRFERGEPQEDIDITHRRVLDRLLEEAGVSLIVWDEEVRQSLVNSWHNQTAWSDSIAGIELLKEDHFVYAPLLPPFASRPEPVHCCAV
ncbi:PPM-type phosphatase domain-containing protein [Mycena venus]|uniref:PPM-type phosphatase domain-containing protein n=1 Tax=Mycena venus TaxID=2733690 RepID=A0A8H6XJT9_9AGAR|nr:PPM-type phosphatase domain-containing protein [Mycena venus]